MEKAIYVNSVTFKIFLPLQKCPFHMFFKRCHTGIPRNFQLENRTYNLCIVLHIFVTLSETLTSNSFFL